MIEALREIETERGIPVALMCAALEEALATAYRQASPEAVDVRVELDPETAVPAIFRRRVVVDEVREPSLEIAVAAAPLRYAVGDVFDEPVKIGGFGRLAALTAKRVIAQRVLEHERERVWAKYRPLQGTIVRGLVQRIVHGAIYVVFDDGHEGVLPANERSPRDNFAINDWLEAELLAVYKTPRGPALILSRSRGSFVRALFSAPAHILATARRAGFVTILATTGGSPPSAEIRDVQAKIGERIDVVYWSADPAELVRQIMPDDAEVFGVEEQRIVIVESATTSPLQLQLAAQLCEWPVALAEPGRSDEVLQAVLDELAAREVPVETIFDAELVRKLEEFAAERAALEDAEEATDG